MYQSRHGKLRLHLTLPFEKRPKGNQPGEYLRYYRLRNNLTTRQLAEQVGIVPATLLKYEQGLAPIPYDTAVRLLERLKIDVSLLCDSFAAFIVSPYTEALKAIREEIKLNQREFAELVGLESKLLLLDGKKEIVDHPEKFISKSWMPEMQNNRQTLHKDINRLQ